jgi:subtilisin family serine protease
MRVKHLADQGAKGQNVNVVVVDRGVDKAQIAAVGGKFAGGWTRNGVPKPGMTRGGHGTMIVRNILAIAPEVTIFDCPLLAPLPSHITDIPASLQDAHCAYEQMIADIAELRKRPKWQGPWIFENAWAVYSRKTDPHGDYTNNPNHPFNQSVARAVNHAKIDVVFCAGNCGQFCPDMMCGPKDRGPGQSILGANSHPDVLTAGAVRTDRMWLGYSSQGPGQPKLDCDKPDFCAASQFCETRDAFATNTGTSAASALTAGVVAALRSKWDASVLTAADLKNALKSTAKKKVTETVPRWQHRLGSGILDAEAAYEAIAASHP